MGAGQHAFLLISQAHKVILDPALQRQTKDRTEEDILYNSEEYVTIKPYMREM